MQDVLDGGHGRCVGRWVGCCMYRLIDLFINGMTAELVDGLIDGLIHGMCGWIG